MPSSGQTPINIEDAEELVKMYSAASKYGLEVEFMAWFVGGMVNNNLNPLEAADGALVEWDL